MRVIHNTAFNFALFAAEPFSRFTQNRDIKCAMPLVNQQLVVFSGHK